MRRGWASSFFYFYFFLLTLCSHAYWRGGNVESLSLEEHHYCFTPGKMRLSGVVTSFAHAKFLLIFCCCICQIFSLSTGVSSLPLPSQHLVCLLFSAFSVPFPVCPLFFAPLVSRCSVSLARPSLLLHIRLAAEGDRGWVMEGGERGGWVGTAEKACGRERHRSTQAQLAETRSYA